ncbi:2,3-bisphosphoglycerate-dependent phosphoglycerate mutase [Streptomyces spinoverrucosus]|uniref:2,3-bisphosphoglycerate-dependent phosphoglycerate mutase n=1 Tax=Streptomyces spinoverrucosus TaxID=284043 RepID=A0A4Y3VCC3_9ACTN|nr:2,3-bisphosphoglycerate-dependent phosphoglycerate mutase [Streptomyces spinoverrucosus]GEC03221.1 2,3-bisphosphoglycerate-dependent phosphoglycerate mutase [Streptomyces spinoverrucosus]GHB37314.1 2,3-bisphosphoglycerate-dependent phosphoglycerate mutase [Streptomyces spinoverrucosus]
MPTLILLRHGESAWNAKNLFTGWVDVDLTPHGEQQARRSGQLLRTAGLRPDAVHTSALTRAQRTATLAMAAADRPEAPVTRSWRLNERHYGALQGREKSDVLHEYGEERFRLWRRSYHAAPPPVADGTAGDVSRDARYADLPPGLLPRTESLADVTARLLPHWYDAVVPDLRAGRTTLVVAHSNSLRALVAHLDRLDDQELLRLNIPTGIPLRYDLDEDLAPQVRGGRYLDPRAAATAAAEVAEQGNRRLRPTR